MRAPTCFVFLTVVSFVSGNVVQDAMAGLMSELSELERVIESEPIEDQATRSSSHNVPESNEVKWALSRIQRMTEELKDVSSTMVELLRENNNMLKSLLPKPEPQPEQLTVVINLSDPELSAFGHVPYIMEPMTIIGGVDKFPEALNIHLEGEFILPENLGIRIGWSHGETDFAYDDLAFSLHVRWNGDHYEYAGEDFVRKLSANFKSGGQWGGPGVTNVIWPFEEYVPFSLDIIYKDGCFTTRINSGSHQVEIPMCHFPEGEGDIYLSLNSDKAYTIPIRLSKIYVSLKETIEI